MATTAHRARDRGASGDRRSLSESGGDRGTAARRWGPRPPAKPANENGVTTGSDATEPTQTINLNPTPTPKTFLRREKQKRKAQNRPMR
jgi:hypothetical protein